MTKRGRKRKVIWFWIYVLEFGFMQIKLLYIVLCIEFLYKFLVFMLYVFSRS